jgi:hypothetical protein
MMHKKRRDKPRKEGEEGGKNGTKGRTRRGTKEEKKKNRYQMIQSNNTRIALISYLTFRVSWGDVLSHQRPHLLHFV